MKSRWIVDSPHEQWIPSELAYPDPAGEMRGGWWIDADTEAPQPNTVMVVIDSYDAKLDEMAADTSHMLFIEDIPDETQTPV